MAVWIAGIGLGAPIAPSLSAQEIPPEDTTSAATLYEYEPDRQRSSLFVVTHKAGLLGFLGHQHAIVAEDWSADLCLGIPVPPTARASVVIRTRALVIDSDSARALAGLGEGPGAEDVAEIQRILLDADHLAAEEHPRITLVVDSTTEDADESVLAHGHLTIRGVTRPVSVPVAVESPASGVARLEGVLRIRQSDFGLTPQSVAGVVNVADEVDLHFALLARETDRPCTPPDGTRTSHNRRDRPYR